MISKRYNEQMGEYIAKLIRESKAQTNADRIRSMTDEELAEFLETLCPSYNWALTLHGMCWLDWLKEVKE